MNGKTQIKSSARKTQRIRSDKQNFHNTHKTRHLHQKTVTTLGYQFNKTDQNKIYR